MTGGHAGDPGRGPQDIDVGEALEIAVRAHRAGDVPVAEALYHRILDAVPNHAAALHFHGVLCHQTGRPREAIGLIRRAIAIEPDNPSAHINLGNVFFELDRPDLAAAAYDTAIQLDPTVTHARSNLGVALRVLGKPDEAEAVYRTAIALDQGHRDLWNNFGRLLASRGRIDEAIACHTRALELEPSDAGTRRYLVTAYCATGEHDRALTLLRGWLEDEPDNPSVHHLIPALTGENVPDRASDRYVQALFDGFASSFDHKLARLDYRAPGLIAAAVDTWLAPGKDLIVLDAGCGTGLCGPALREHARHLVGVDLSAGMLDKARQRGCYDRLDQAELTTYLRDHPQEFDLVTSADTLCYFGPLDEVAAAAAAALRKGGTFVFSVEESDRPAFTLHPHGRYSHARRYVEGCFAAAGFSTISIDRESLRMERGQAVPGLIVTAMKG